jgi:hypothetical protein
MAILVFSSLLWDHTAGAARPAAASAAADVKARRLMVVTFIGESSLMVLAARLARALAQCIGNIPVRVFT